MKDFKVIADEYYPFYFPYEGGTKIKVSNNFIDRFNKILDLFNALQNEIERKVKKESEAK